MAEQQDGQVEPPWWQAPRPGRRRQPLSRSAILDAAITILDEEGASALTVRRLGEALNTGSATLYWHVGSTSELGEMIYDRVMGELRLPEPDPDRWQEQVKDMARQAYRVMLTHAGVVQYSIGRIPVGPNMLAVMEWAVDLLRKAGLSDKAAAYAGDMLGRYLDVSVLEVTATGGPPPEQVGQYFMSLPADRYPNMAFVAQSMANADDDDRFEFGLDLLIRGLATHTTKPPRGKGRRSRGGPSASD